MIFHLNHGPFFLMMVTSQIKTRSTAYEQRKVEAKEENTNSKERCCFFPTYAVQISGGGLSV